MTDTIKTGDTISVDYTGKKDDGTVFDSSQGRTPLKFTVGAGMLIKGFDDAVVGMKTGESKTIVIPPEEGYGHRDENAYVDIPRQNIPEDLPLEKGIALQLQGPDGRPLPAIVTEITDEKVRMDINHFLAGETLTFDITIRETGLTPDSCGCGGSGEDCSSDCSSGCGSDGCGC